MRQMRYQLLQPASNLKFYQDQLYGCIMSAIVLFAELILKTRYNTLVGPAGLEPATKRL